MLIFIHTKQRSYYTDTDNNPMTRKILVSRSLFPVSPLAWRMRCDVISLHIRFWLFTTSWHKPSGKLIPHQDFLYSSSSRKGIRLTPPSPPSPSLQVQGSLSLFLLAIDMVYKYIFTKIVVFVKSEKDGLFLFVKLENETRQDVTLLVNLRCRLFH